MPSEDVVSPIEQLKANRYPGRGLVIGRNSANDGWFLLYWLMGRSMGSRNRRLVVQGSTLRAESFDLSDVADPSLLVYEAMLEGEGQYVVGNGDQVRTAFEHLRNKGSFEAGLSTRDREPDAPHYTPRITGLLDLRGGSCQIQLSILKASIHDPERTDRIYFRPETPSSGSGLALHTYKKDGQPLLPFEGAPLVVPLEGTMKEVLDRYWSVLDRENRVALAVKYIPDSGRSSQMLVVNARG